MTKYFCHDSNMLSNRKVVTLRRKFSHTGYSIWCMLLEQLTASDDYTITFNERNIITYAGLFDIEEDMLMEIVDFSAKIGLLSREGEVVSCPALIERFADYDTRAEELREATEQKQEEIARARSEAGKRGMTNRWKGKRSSDNNGITNDNNGITNDNNGITNDNNGITNDNNGITNDNNGITNDNNGITNDNIKNKNKNKNIIVVGDTEARVHTREGEPEGGKAGIDSVSPELGAYVEQEAARMWLEAVAMKHKLSIAQVKARLPDFAANCIAQGAPPEPDLQSAKRHFDNWLRVRLQAEKNQIHNATTPTTTNRSPNSPDAVARRMAEYEALDAYLASH